MRNFSFLQFLCDFIESLDQKFTFVKVTSYLVMLTLSLQYNISSVSRPCMPMRINAQSDILVVFKKKNESSTFLTQFIFLNYRTVSFHFLSAKTFHQNLFWQSKEINSRVKELSRQQDSNK